MHLTVRVSPRSSRNLVAGFDESGALIVRVTAPPADGAANAAVTRLLAKALGLPPRDVVLISGATSRVKRFEIPLEAAEVVARVARRPTGS